MKTRSYVKIGKKIQIEKNLKTNNHTNKCSPLLIFWDIQTEKRMRIYNLDSNIN